MIFVSLGGESGTSITQKPLDNVLLATLSKTYKDKQHATNNDKLTKQENPSLPSTPDIHTQAQRSSGSPEKITRGSYTVKQGGTRESALLSGHPIITESIKVREDAFK